jgi:prolycopene isomerase
MEKYDVVIIGGGLGGLTTAAYLSKRLRNVAVFEEGSRKKLQKYTNRLKDEFNNKFEFKFYNYDVGGVHEGDLFFEYVKTCGLENNFEYDDNTSVTIVDKNKRTVKRPNDYKNFLIYLVRHYPKQRDEIHRLFNDISRHHKHYKEQKIARLNNLEYTIPSLLIEWGDLSLYSVLGKYFSNEDLINEFTLVYDSIGMPINEINAYNYFIKWFDTFIDGAHFIKTSFDKVVKTFTTEISKTKEKVFTNRKINEFIIVDNKIEKIIDNNGIEIQAKHYVINMRIDDFIDKYLPEALEIKEKFHEMYFTKELGRTINQVYIGLNKDAKALGIKDKHYLFSNIPTDDVRLLSLVNYKEIDKTSCKAGKGAILVEFLDDDLPRKHKLTQVIDQVAQYFPDIVDNIAVSKIGKKRNYFSGLSSKEYWKNKTVNDLFDIDNYNELNPFVNGYFIGSWVKPEAGITGMIQTGVEYGDKIDELIYHGEDEEYFITHDELMAIISHQFIPNALGKQEKNIQFTVGKDNYFIRTKAKHQRLYKGINQLSDIIIIATNDCLYDLSVGNTTLEKALKSGTLEYIGEKAFLEEVIEGFDMGIEIESAQKYEYKQGKYGIKFMLAIIGVLVLSNLLGNYNNYVIVAPITFGVLGIILYFKYRILNLLIPFEIFIMSLYFVIAITSIFVSELNELHDSKYMILLFATYWLITWLINKPIAFGYIRHDYRTDYTRTKLFKSMAGGLTFIWGVMFLTIGLLSFTMIQSYATLTYYLAVIGLYLTYYYPNSYIKGTIEKQTKG